ncbi:MAG: SsrA-binding protein SmpB [Deltaproteobacteria bacterium]|nr:SsrA-binding protein SmpB [Deltaproteobacteria bacterium]
MAKDAGKKKSGAKNAPAPEATKLIVDNRKARFDYHLQDKLEAGIELKGTEVKSLREGKINLGDAYCSIIAGEVFLVDAHITPYSHGTHFNHEPLRKRKLLLNRQEIRRLEQRVREKGFTIIPTRVYWKRGRVKVEIALARGKKEYDKREQIKTRDIAREMQRHD